MLTAVITIRNVSVANIPSLPNRLVTLPLWRRHTDGNVVLLGELGSWELGGEAREGGLVVRHLDGEGLDVGDLVDLEGTSALHGDLKLGDEVLAETHWPAVLDTTDGADVLVDKAVDLGDGAVDLDGLARESGGDLLGTEAEASGWLGLNRGEVTDGLEEITNGGEVAALALGEVVLDLIGRGGRVGLEGKVVIGNLLAVTLDGGEHVVGHVLDRLGDGGEESLLGRLNVGHGGLLDLLHASLTDGDGTVNVLVEVGNHGVADSANVGTVSLGGGLLVEVKTGGLGDALLVGGSVGGDLVDESVSAGSENRLGGLEGLGGLRLVGGEIGVEVGHGGVLGETVLGELLEKVLGGLGEVLLEAPEGGGLLTANLLDLGSGGVTNLLGVASGLGLVLVHEELDGTTLLTVGGLHGVGNLEDALELTVDVLVDFVLLGLVGPDLTSHNVEETLDLLLSELGLGDGGINAELHGGGGLGDLVVSSLAGGLEVLDSLGEVHIVESRALGDGGVESRGLVSESLTDCLALVGHVGVELGELLVGGGGGVGDTVGDGLDDGIEAL